VLDEPCAAALARDAGQLVSCGLLYSDGDEVNVSANNSMQVGLPTSPHDLRLWALDGSMHLVTKQ
jgi:hypothetical protein